MKAEINPFKRHKKFINFEIFRQKPIGSGNLGRGNFSILSFQLIPILVVKGKTEPEIFLTKTFPAEGCPAVSLNNEFI
jgi:hypothetical protein